MGEDIFFYNFEFDLVYILPMYSPYGGCISVNCDKDFNDNGSAEILFFDTALKKLIESNPTEIFFKWGNFYGFITSYEFKETQHRVMGMSLNGLIHRAIKQKLSSMTDTAENIVKAVLQGITWLSVESDAEFTNKITYSCDKCKAYDEMVQEILSADNGGYEITADIKNKKFIFRIKKAQEKELILSNGNLNAYNFVSDFNGKETANSGFYKDSDGTWHEVTTQEKSGVYNISCILSANNEKDALKELQEKKAVKSVTADIKKLQYGIDYNLGDIVKLQNDDVTVKKMITSVNIHQDIGYGATPTFKDWEE